jgi:hypothetical protein
MEPKWEFVDLVSVPGDEYILILRDVKSPDAIDQVFVLDENTIRSIVNSFKG